MVIRSAGKELLRRLLPLAEKYDQKLGYEIHAPHGPERPQDPADPRDVRRAAVGPARLHRRLQLHHAQPVPDAVPHVGADGPAGGALRRHAGDLAQAGSRCTSATTSSRTTCASHDFDPARLGPFTRLAFNMHGLVPPEEWLDIMPQIFHVHAKFYDIDENGDEPAMDIPRIVRQFVEGGYQATSPASGRATRSPTSARPIRSIS